LTLVAAFTVLGGVYTIGTPLALDVADIDPQEVTEQDSAQVTPRFDGSFVTVAVTLFPPVPAATFNEVGTTLIPTAGVDTIVTAAVPVLEPSATLVAVMVIFGGVGTDAGAVYVNEEPA
jgi:hypothetical protein